MPKLLKTAQVRSLIYMPLVSTVLCLVFLGGSALAATQSGSTVETTANVGVTVSRLRLGLGGFGRVGCWIPIHIEATGFASGANVQVLVIASDARGDQCEDTVSNVKADTSGSISAASVFMNGRLDSAVTIRLSDKEGSVSWEHVVRCRSVDDFSISTAPSKTHSIQTELKLLRYGPITFVTIGVPDALATLANELAEGKSTSASLVVMSVESIDDLPSIRRGLDSVDFLYLVDGFNLSEQQRQAVEEWVTTGGHLVVSCGSKLPQLLESSVGNWLQPVFQIEPAPMFSQDLSGLQNFVAGSSQLQTYRKSVPVMKLRSNQAWSVVDSINGPLVQRVSYGAGMISMVAVDLNQKPVNQWLSLPQLYEMLIFGYQLDTSASQMSRNGRISSSGVSDLATQLATVSDAVPSANRWSTWSIMLLMVVFLLVIGPLDYLFVVRIVKKPHLTWFTFPALIIASCLLAVSWVGTREVPIVVRQTHLVDVAQPAARQTVHVRSWNSISAADSGNISVGAGLSPIAATEKTAALTGTKMSVSWHGRPEDVYGGLYREGGVMLGRQMSHRSDGFDGKEAGFSSVPMLSDGSQAFLAEALVDASASMIVESHLRVPSSGLLEGEFTHHFASPIKNWSVVFRNRVYRPTPKVDTDNLSIEPGKPWSRENYSVSVSDLREFLKGVRATQPEAKPSKSSATKQVQIKACYDTQGTNPLDILTMVSLFKVPGGETFVKLQNNAMRHDDLSDGIHLNTVFVVGTLDTQVTEIIVNGKTVTPVQSQTIVRLLLPVVRSGEESKMADPVAVVSAQ